jgi:elongation factor G
MLATHKSTDVRTIALVGHGAAGKTYLSDALLFQAKAVDRLGSVDDGTSVSDYDDEEHRRHFSIDTSVLHLDHQGRCVYLLDAPGYPDFVGAALESLNAVENALVVVSATDGVCVNTRRMAAEAQRRGLARLVALTKLDADKIDLSALLHGLQETFGRQCVPVNLPLGTGPGIRGVVSVLDPPADAPVDLLTWRARLIDAVCECDDGLMEKYLTDGDLTAADLAAALPRAVASGCVMPVFCTAGKKNIGVNELLDGLVAFTLSPLQGHKRPLATDGQPADDAGLEPAEDGEFVGQVFKTVNDKFVGHLAFLRVFRGHLTPDQPLVNLRTGKAARVNALFQMQGKAHTNLAEAVAGDIVAVAKVDGLHIGDTVATKPGVPPLAAPPFPQPMFGLAVAPKQRGDEQKISAGLQKIAEEDATFRFTHDPQTHELVISGVSPLHLDVVQQRLRRRFDLEVVTHEPKVPYRETISGQAEANHRHKKQSGGRGQFAEVHLRVYALPREIDSPEKLQEQFANKSRFEKMRSVHYDREHNFAFIDHIVGGTIPNQFMPAVEKGCKEALERGVLAGYRIQDVAVEVFFGKDHPVDSSEAAFKTAGRQAFKKAFLAAHPMLLEPVVRLEVTAPSKYTGAILGDLNTKRAQVENQDSLPGDLAVITALVPLAEVARYAAQLGSLSHGTGSYAMEFSHYDVVPPNVQQQIVSKAKLADDEEE